LTTHATAQNEPTGYIELLRSNPNFRKLWTGQVISLFGDWFNLIASASLISELTQSGTAVGSLFVIRMLAPFLISPIAGVAADRYNRKTLLILSDLSRFVVVLGFLLVRSQSQVWLLYALTAIQLAISGVFTPARTAILPDIVSRRELGAANALSSATWSVMLAVGAAIGGLVAGQYGIYPAFVVDSLTFLLSAMMIFGIRYTHIAPLDEAGKTIAAGFRQYLAGLAYLKDHRDILFIALHKGAIALTMNGVFQIIQVTLAEKVFVIGEGGGTSLGLMYAVGGIGTGLGPILARRFTGDQDRSLRRALVLSYLLAIAGLLITARLSSFGIVLFGTFLRAFGGGINWVFSTQLLLQLLPDRVRGRVFSSEFAIFTLLNAIGTAMGGYLMDLSGISLTTSMLWLAGLTLIPTALWFLWVSLGKSEPVPAESHGD
jgi:MFS family permease